jgi:cation transport regulator
MRNFPRSIVPHGGADRAGTARCGSDVAADQGADAAGSYYAPAAVWLRRAIWFARRGVQMPYASIADLPSPLQAHLPTHAQEIFRAAFNNAWAEYDTADREEIAHRVAWAAVKRKYRKQGNE